MWLDEYDPILPCFLAALNSQCLVGPRHVSHLKKTKMRVLNYSELSLRRTPSGLAVAVCLRDLHTLKRAGTSQQFPPWRGFHLTAGLQRSMWDQGPKGLDQRSEAGWDLGSQPWDLESQTMGSGSARF